MACRLTPTMSALELAGRVDEKTSCICFFGGDPTPQLPHAIKTSEIALKDAKDILRICWESNGTMSRHSKILDGLLSTANSVQILPS